MERITPQSTRHVLKGLAAGAAVCGLLLTGCASTNSPSGVSQAGAGEGVVAVGAVGTGPFSTFKADQLNSIQLAQRVMRLECIADNGYPDIAATIATKEDSGVRGQLEVTSDDHFFASAEDAAARGFGQPTPASPAKVIPHDAAFGAISDTCDEQAWQALGENAQATVFEYQGIHARLSSGPMNAVSRVMPDLTAKLAECLSDQGHPVTTGGGSWGMDFGIKLGTLERPDAERPGPRATKGLEILPATPANPYIPTAEESVLASALYECSQTTGVRAEMDQVILAAQQKAAGGEAAAIENLNPKIQALADKSGSAANA